MKDVLRNSNPNSELDKVFPVGKTSYVSFTSSSERWLARVAVKDVSQHLCAGMWVTTRMFQKPLRTSEIQITHRGGWFGVDKPTSVHPCSSPRQGLGHTRTVSVTGNRGLLVYAQSLPRAPWHSSAGWP